MRPADPGSYTELVLLLHGLAGVGERSLASILQRVAVHRATSAEVLAASAQVLRDEYGLPDGAAAQLAAEREARVSAAARLARDLSAAGVAVLVAGGAAWPVQVDANEPDAPPVLYARGQLSLLNGGAGFTFAVAVSRSHGAGDMEALRSAADELVAVGGVPVVGPERAPWQQAALAAMRRDRPVIYVADRGLRDVLGPRYEMQPFKAARIWSERFRADRDLVLSPFHPAAPHVAGNKPRRDRLLFSLADAAVCGLIRPGGTMEAECLRLMARGVGAWAVPGIEPGAGSPAGVLAWPGADVVAKRAVRETEPIASDGASVR